MSEYVFVRNTTMAGTDAPLQVVYALPGYDAHATAEELIASSALATHIKKHPVADVVERIKAGKGSGFGYKVKRYLDNGGGMVISTLSVAE